MAATYKINEIYYSLQGEGVRAGIPHVFVRFSGCNEQCRIATHGFDCDTDFFHGEALDLAQIHAAICAANAECRWLLLTGGEPSLQLDQAFVDYFHERGYQCAIETNGANALPSGIDWITLSPKSDESNLGQQTAHEVKYVRAAGQALPETRIQAEHYLISPAFADNTLAEDNLQWCLDLVRNNPQWRLSLQQHKIWQIP